MKCTLQVDFEINDYDPEANELVEDLRDAVKEAVIELTDTDYPNVKIWDRR